MFSGFYLTTKGQALLAKAQAGETLSFTRFQVGKGSLSSGQSAESVTALIDPVSYFNVAAYKARANNAIISFQLTNAGITNSWYFREVGLFANDPDDGEILYAYGNAGTDADLIPASTASLYECLFSLDIIISNVENVTAEISDGLIYATKKYVDEEIAQVSLSGMGVTASVTELNYMDGVTSNVQTQINDLSGMVGNKSVSDQITEALADMDAITNDEIDAICGATLYAGEEVEL